MGITCQPKGKAMQPNDLGLMSRDTWETLSVQQQTWYLYDAVVNRCTSCGAMRGKFAKALVAMSPALIVIGAALGGMLARYMGIEVQIQK